jgi:hypothetical protein
MNLIEIIQSTTPKCKPIEISSSPPGPLEPQDKSTKRTRVAKRRHENCPTRQHACRRFATHNPIVHPTWGSVRYLSLHPRLQKNPKGHTYFIQPRAMAFAICHFHVDGALRMNRARLSRFASIEWSHSRGERWIRCPTLRYYGFNE